MTRPVTTATRRPGFTLVELLVAMAVIVALAAIALIVVPDVLTQDRTTDGAGTVRQTLMIAKARALRDRGPRGVRFLVADDNPPNVPDPSNLAKTNGRWVTELQFIEKPDPIRASLPDERIEVEFQLTEDGKDPPPVGALKSPPAVYFMNMSAPVKEYMTQEFGASPSRPVVFECVLPGGEPVRLTATAATPASGIRASTTNPPSENFQLTLDPAESDLNVLMAAVGAGRTTAIRQFTIDRSAQPLLGEQTVPLPKNVCVDLVSSQPAWASTARDFDILFAPTGEVLPTSGSGNAAQVNLWVRDFTKLGGAGAGVPFDRGGEQQVVALKAKSGAVGVFPIHQDQNDPFKFAKEGASSP